MPYFENQNMPGELFKLLRSLKGIKQDEAARKLEVSQQAISKLEKCKSIQHPKFTEIMTVFQFSKEDIDTAKRYLKNRNNL
jgi:DNA-binding XRE family transcriptional regulator